MIPYLEITGKRRADINRLLKEHCKDHATLIGVRSILEEFGTSFDEIRQVLSDVTEKGNLAPGLWDAVVPLLEGERNPSHDWRGVPRSTSGF